MYTYLDDDKGAEPFILALFYVCAFVWNDWKIGGCLHTLLAKGLRDIPDAKPDGRGGLSERISEARRFAKISPIDGFEDSRSRKTSSAIFFGR